MAKFVISTRKNGEFQFTLYADNNLVILNSEGYKTMEACMKGLDSVRKNSFEDSQFDRLVATNGEWYFNLRAKNNQVIGTSQMYSSIETRDKGIESVKRNAPYSEAIIAEDALA